MDFNYHDMKEPTTVSKCALLGHPFPKRERIHGTHRKSLRLMERLVLAGNPVIWCWIVSRVQTLLGFDVSP